MAYATDLADLDLADGASGWTLIGSSKTLTYQDSNFAIQGSPAYAVSSMVSGAGTRGGHVAGPKTAVVPGADTHFFVWVYTTAPGLGATLSVGGMFVAIGTGTTAYNQFHVQGSDTNQIGGWQCYPIRYVTTSNTGSPPYRTLVGSPTANPTYFGGGLQVTATLRAGNLAVDACRHGTGIYITAGSAGTPNTFSGAAGANDAATARWGVFQSQGGGIYAQQGRLVIGQDTAKTATAAYFADANATITFTDTPHCLSNFSQVIVDHASTTFNLTSCTFIGLGTTNPGMLTFNNASTTSALTGCTFANMGLITLRGAVTATNCVFRSVGINSATSAIIQNNATLTGCQITPASGPTRAVLSDNPTRITNCAFTSAGTGHAIEITTAGTYDFTGNTFTGYSTANPGSNLTPSSGSTDAMIYNNSGAAVTINLLSGTNPTVRNGAGAGCTTTIIAGNKTVTLTGLKNPSEVRVFNQGTTTERTGTGAENVTNGTHSFTLPSGTAVDISVISLGYQNMRILNFSTSTDTSIPISQVLDRQYLNP